MVKTKSHKQPPTILGPGAGKDKVETVVDKKKFIKDFPEFQEDEPDMGDQFMACKPWLGAIKKPTTGPGLGKTDLSAPKENFVIDFVHGYKSN